MSVGARGASSSCVVLPRFKDGRGAVGQQMCDTIVSVALALLLLHDFHTFTDITVIFTNSKVVSCMHQELENRT